MIPKLIVFDFDGVIVNSEDVMIEALHKLLKDYKIDVSLSECCKAFVGNDTVNTLNKFLKKHNSTVTSKEIFKKLLELKHTLLVNIEKIPYIENLLENLVNLKIPYCIASNSSLEHINEVLRIVNLNRFFSNNKFSAVVLNKFKPDSAVYLEALSKMGFEAKESLAIEDSLPGVQAAHGAKLPVIGLLSSSITDHSKHSDLLEQNGAFKTINSLKYIINLINQ